MKVLHLIDSLDFNGSARQVSLLGPVLAHEKVDVEICCLGPASPWQASLSEAGAAVTTLGWTRWLDPHVPWKLRSLLERSAPDLIHVWRLPALRALALVAPKLLPRVVMSAPLPAHGRLSWWDRRLLQRVRYLAVAGVSDQASCLRQGLSGPTLRVVPPATAPAAPPTMSHSSHSPLSIVCAGRLERDEGFRLAVWAFDIILQVYPDAQLKLVGSGSQRQALHEMTHGLKNSSHVHFLGEQTDVAAIFRSANLVWVPSAANCGRQTALDAMAQGCAVLASDVPCLRDVIIDGETGYLLPTGSAVSFARRTHELFRAPARAEQLGQRARRQIAERFSVAEAARRWRDVYANAALPLAA